MGEPNPPKKINYKKLILLGVAFVVIPGSSLIVVGYGIKKLLEQRKR